MSIEQELKTEESGQKIENYFFTAEKDAHRQRLDKYIHEKIGHRSKMFLTQQIKDGACRVNGKTQLGGYKIQEGDRIEVFVEHYENSYITPENIELNIVFEDDALLVINKPAGILVHPTGKVRSGTLLNALVFYLNFQDICDAETPEKYVRGSFPHRLDRETSGLIIAAKTDRAQRIISQHLERKLLNKTYVALVRGVFETDEMILDAPIGRIEEVLPHWQVTAEGRAARSEIRVLQRFADKTLLEMKPITGRTNQLRVHAAYLGHSICGDIERDAEPAPRMCLHAQKLGFYHPDGGWLEFETEIPAEFLTFGNEKTKI